ncbi:MAG TPA: hypothetical protein VFQ45_07040 [Longimicrobium sp.]|nr:hypothetical protein [Longimicrobium sp.]
MRGYDRHLRARRGYDAGYGRERAWSEDVAYGRAEGMGGGGPGQFVPLGWDPMMRWAGWDPLAGFVPYQDAPPEWGYGLQDDVRYDHEYYRGARGGYGRDHYRGYDRDVRFARGAYDREMRPRGGYDRDVRFARGGYDREMRVPPRQSPTYGRGGDRAVREWAARQGYGVEGTIQPRRGPWR